MVRRLSTECPHIAAGETLATAADRGWFITQRWQAYDAEGRANFLRIIAVGGFYLVHLWSYFSSRGDVPGGGFWQLAEPGEIGYRFHVIITLLSLAWAMLALGVMLALQQRFFPRWLPYFSTAGDIVLLTSVICLGAAARSPLVVGFFLIVIVSGLRLSLPLVWFATAGCLLGYLCVLGVAKWPIEFGVGKLFDAIPADLRVPRYHQAIVLLAIVLAGVTLGQIVRRVRYLLTGENGR